MHILLVDDEVGVITNLALYLRHMGHTSSSLRRLRGQEELHAILDDLQPDAVILDFEMPTAGDEVYRWIKNWNPSTKIVFYTAYGDSAFQRHRMLAVGAMDGDIILKREIGADITSILKALT